LILLDANVLMYAAGREHPHKRASADLVDRIGRGTVDAAIDAEILQEILHRYRALRRPGDGFRLYDLTRTVVRTVLPVTDAVMDEARSLLESHPRLSARDAVHAAVSIVFSANAFCSYDRDFDRIEGLRRVEPGALLRPV
jgi:predicted nucleic acid-binding protein